MKSKSLTWNQQGAVNRVCQTLISGGVALTTTDTVIGLLGKASGEVRDTLDTIKGRSQKPYLVLVDSIATAEKLADLALSEKGCALAQACWPGPLTLIVKARPETPIYMKSPEGLIALRVPDHAGLLEVIRELGPLFSTSANKTTESVPIQMSDINPEIIRFCTVIVSDDKPSKSDQASTILDVSHGRVKLVRAGAYPLSELERICGCKIQ